MTQILGALVVLGGMAFLIWMGFRSARQAGAAEQQAKEAANVVKAAERVADATADAPRDADELDRRVRDGSWPL